jgi:hypothetical protein
MLYPGWDGLARRAGGVIDELRLQVVEMFIESAKLQER